jgi:hypothetical protein
VAALAFAGAPPSGVLAKTAARALCTKYRCRTVTADADARVLRARRVDREGIIRYSGTFVQWLPHERLTPLGDQYTPDHVQSAFMLERPALSGRFLAYVLVLSGKYNGEGAIWTIDRVDAEKGRKEEARGSRLGGEPGGTVTTPCDGGLAQGSPGVTDLTVSSSGAVAWIIGAAPNRFPSSTSATGSTYTVCALPAGSRTPQVLAGTKTTAPGSLAIAGELVYWSESGSPRAARVGAAR